MIYFDDYFCDENIINILCKIRISDAKKRHDKQFYKDISSKAPNPHSVKSIVDKFFPPRKQWLRPYRNERSNKCAFEINLLALKKTVSHKIKTQTTQNELWYKELTEFIKKIKVRALQDNSCNISSPKIKPLEKDKAASFKFTKQSLRNLRNKGIPDETLKSLEPLEDQEFTKENEFLKNIEKQVGQEQSVRYKKLILKYTHKTKYAYRPIAEYNLEDKIIIALTANYLRDAFDQDFLSCSYAFRAKGNKQRKTPTHHIAVQDLIDYSKKYDGKILFVAECDITKFYDTVHHDVARKALNRAIERANNRGIYVDSRAISIFNSSLNSYTFFNTARPQAEKWFKQHNIEGNIGQPEKGIAKFYSNVFEEPIGVPQGGALSPIIANLVLDRADREVIQDIEMADVDLFYARYCDDMILIHPVKEKCEQAFDRYIEASKCEKLAAHEPQCIEYPQNYYDCKSKQTFMWGKQNGTSNIAPWISFCGYEIRYDQTIRIRKKSMKKELEKQVKVADKIIEVLNSKKRVSNKSRGQILFRLTNKLISMSVGRVQLGKHYKHISQFCWASGFKLLKENEHIRSQLRRLDRNRERQISRINRRLQQHDVKFTKTNRDIDVPEYYGAPFSYYAQFIRQDKSDVSESET